MTKSKIFLCFCLSFIGGVMLDSLFEISQPIWLGILISGIVFVVLGIAFPKIWECDSQKIIIVFGFCLLVLLIGAWHHQRVVSPKEIESASQYYDQEVVFKGVVINEPEKRISQIKMAVRPLSHFSLGSDPKGSDPTSPAATKDIGKILITTGLYPEYDYGDELEIKGQFRKPSQFEGFDYQAYLAKDKIYSVIYYPEIILLNKNQGNWFWQTIFNFKDKLRNNIELALLPPQGAILKAVFLGDKYGLSDDLKEKLNISGTRHITAVSGMHMIIMSQILLFLGLGMGLWRGQAFYFVLIILFLYILMIGVPASAVRAGIMAGLLLLAQKMGRLRSADQAVVFAGTAMLAINPLLLKDDVGFQLSFMACLSIIYLKPIFDKKTINWPSPFQLKDILTMTLSAQLGVLPFLIFHFGQFSLVSPLANLMIVPFLPLIMLSGIILGLTGLIYMGLAKILAGPVWLLLTYLIKVIEYLSSLSWASYEFGYVSWLFLAGYYLVLVWFIWYNALG